MLQCIAVDDEPLALHLLEDYLTRVPDIRLVAKCSDAFEAGKVLRSQPIDLMFLDIQMPGLTGLQFIQSLAQKPMVILVTAYEQFALEGYALDVVDYLLKPVELDRFLKACNKAWELHQLRAGKGPEYFFVNVDYSLAQDPVRRRRMDRGFEGLYQDTPEKQHPSGRRPYERKGSGGGTATRGLYTGT